MVDLENILQRIKFLVVLFSFYCFSAVAQQQPADNFQFVYGDFDGDIKLDALEISHDAARPTRFYSDLAGANTKTDIVFSVDSTAQYIVAGDFDNDRKSEIVVLDASLNGHYYLLNEARQLEEGPEKLKIKGYNKNRRIDFTNLYKGDFNGDGSDDLLAYSAETHDIVVFHNKQTKNKIKFKFDAQLHLDNQDPLTLKIRDFNEDGLQDIALLSHTQNGGSFVAFAGKKGRFKKSDFEDISPYLNGEDFSTQQHSILLWTDASSNEQVLVRRANKQGGYDEEGNYLNDDLSPYTAGENTSMNCQHLAYFPSSKSTKTICLNEADMEASDSTAAAATKNVSDSDKSASHNRNAKLSLNTANNDPSLQSSGSINSPAWVNAEVKPGNDIFIQWAPVNGVHTYNRQVSLNGSASWINNKEYPSTQTSVTFPNQQVRSYRYRVNACNSASICSGWRVSNTVTVHASPTVPADPTGIPSLPGGSYQLVNSSIAVNVPAVAGSNRYTLYMGTSADNVEYVATSTSTNFNNIPVGGNWGYRYIKYKACNAHGCSGLSQWRRILVYSAPGTVTGLSVTPTIAPLNSSATLSWNKTGGIIPSGYYKVYKTAPNQAETEIATVTSGGNASHSINVAINGIPGSYSFRVRAFNPGTQGGGSATVSANGINIAPLFPSGLTPLSRVNVGQEYRFQFSASDANNHSLTYSVSGNPSWLSINSTTGLLIGTPSQAGAYSNIRVSVSDSYSTTQFPSFNITAVIAPPGIPTGLSPSKVGENLRLDWNDTSSATYYIVDIKEEGGAFTTSGSPTLSQWDFSNLDTGLYDLRVAACNGSGCGGYSSPITHTFEELRDTADANGNDIRDDVDRLIAREAPNSAFNQAVLSHYAYFTKQLSEFAPATNGDLTAMEEIYLRYYFRELVEAQRCTALDESFEKIEAKMLDSEIAFIKWLDTQETFINEVPNSWHSLTPDCEITPASASNGFQPSYVRAMQELVNPEVALSKMNQSQNNSFLQGTSNWDYVFYFNGLNTSLPKALVQREKVQIELIREGLNPHNVGVVLAYNQNEELLTQAHQVLVQYYRQFDFSEYSAWERARNVMQLTKPMSVAVANNILDFYSNRHPDIWVENEDIEHMVYLVDLYKPHGDIVALSYSQGNVHATKTWEFDNHFSNGAGYRHFRQVAVGTPYSYVANNGPWINNSLDKLLLAINTAGLYPTKAFNVSINGDDWLNHGLLETYFKYPSIIMIANAIKEQFEDMERLKTLDPQPDPPGPPVPPGPPIPHPSACVPLHFNGSFNHSFEHNPGNYIGPLRIKFEAFTHSNSLNIRTDSGLNLLSTPGYISGEISTIINYNRATHGLLEINVMASNQTSDGWTLDLECQ